MRLMGRLAEAAVRRTVESEVEARVAPVRAARDALRASLVAVVRGLPPGSAVLVRRGADPLLWSERKLADLVADAEEGRALEVASVRCGYPPEYPPDRGAAFDDDPEPTAVDPQSDRAKASLAALLSSLPEGTRVQVRSEALAQIGAPPVVEAAWLAAEARDGRFYDLTAVRLPSPKRSPPEAIAAVDAAIAGLMSSIEGRRGASSSSGGRKGALRGRKRS